MFLSKIVISTRHVYTCKCGGEPATYREDLKSAKMEISGYFKMSQNVCLFVCLVCLFVCLFVFCLFVCLFFLFFFFLFFVVVVFFLFLFCFFFRAGLFLISTFKRIRFVCIL